MGLFHVLSPSRGGLRILQGHQPFANELWSSAHLRQNPIFRPSGRIGAPIKGPRQGADCSD